MEITTTSKAIQSAQIEQLRQDLEKINKNLFDATARTAIILIDSTGLLVQTNNYFEQLFRNTTISSIEHLPIKNTYGACESTNGCLTFLTKSEEQILPKVEMLIEGKLSYFTIVSTAINNDDHINENLSKRYIISLTDITNVVELHKNEISISKELAYKQGIFDVTSEYIHNIGNVITGAQHLADRIVKNLEPMQGFFKYFDITKQQVSLLNELMHEENNEEFQKRYKKIEMSLNIIESSLTDTIKNVLESDMKSLQKGIDNISATISSQQELYKSNKINMDEEVDIGVLINEVKSVIEPQLIRNNIDIKLQINETVVFTVNRIHLYNGILNLIKNSIHALNDAFEQGIIENKEIIVKATNEKRYDGFFELDMMQSDQLITSNNVLINVIDNGIGIDIDKKEKIFIQGFTTKTEGSGLGLHSFANFLISNGHSISYHSDGYGHGACFSVLLAAKE